MSMYQEYEWTFPEHHWGPCKIGNNLLQKEGVKIWEVLFMRQMLTLINKQLLFCNLAYIIQNHKKVQCHKQPFYLDCHFLKQTSIFERFGQHK